MARHQPMHRRGLLALLPPLGVAALGAGCASGEGSGHESGAERKPDGTVEMRMAQAAFIGSGAGGTGTLVFHGRRHPFNVGGAGIGGIGASSIDAEGEVYNLRQLSDFPGLYGQARAGAVFGDRSTGHLWLQNPAGVVMRLRARRTGLMLSLGGDAVLIAFRE